MQPMRETREIHPTELRGFSLVFPRQILQPARA